MLNQKVKEVQKETIKNALQLLNLHKKCLMVRPTGFGKNKCASEIMKKYKRVVFVYPNTHIEDSMRKYNIESSDCNVQYMTYCKLRNLYKLGNEQFKKIFSEYNTKSTIFVFDEAHLLGAGGTSVVVRALMDDICEKANYLAMTATPKRTDRLDIKWHFFGGHTVFDYTLEDAINDGLYLKPTYVYTPLDKQTIAENCMNLIDDSNLSSSKKEAMKKDICRKIDPSKTNIENISEIIENYLDKFQNEDDYYKFICFFGTCQNLHEKRQEIVNAFKNVFPHCDINVIIVTSESKLYHDNIKKVDKLCHRRNTVDLILNVNIFTFGYHVSDITGILMFRKTISDIIFTQQCGRCFNVIAKDSSIIFDFIENLFRFSNGFISIDESQNRINGRMKTVLPIDSIYLEDETKDIAEICRLTLTAINSEIEQEIVNAYKNNLVDLDYCIHKLGLQEYADFDKLLRRYV